MKLLIILILSFSISFILFAEGDNSENIEINNLSGMYVNYEMWNDYFSWMNSIDDSVVFVKNTLYPLKKSVPTETGETIIKDNETQIEGLASWSGFIVGLVTSAVFDIDVEYELHYLENGHQFDPDGYR